MWGQKGATFLEVLLFLSLIVFMSSLVLPIYEGTQARKEIEQFINQLQADMNWAMQYADTHQKYLYWYIFEKNHVYYFQQEDKKLFVRYYPKNIRIEHNLPNKRIKIQPTGTISNNGTLKIYYHEKLMASLYVQLYSGVIREEWH